MNKRRRFLRCVVVVVFAVAGCHGPTTTDSRHNDVAPGSPPLLHMSPRVVAPSIPNARSEILWHEWSEEVFREAQNEDKLVLLDLTAVWCHACHVMDASTYQDPLVAQLVRESYIAIRVDTDQRPDIDARYRNGGWPTTSLLLPTGEIVFQANFMEASELAEALREAIAHYRTHGEELAHRAADVWETVEAAQRARTQAETEIDDVGIDRLAFMIAQQYDHAHGGFGTGAKFFEPDAITFLFALHHHAYDDPPDATWQSMALKTLDQQRALVDPVWGGFYRYAEEADWMRPHYEKLLHLQAMNLLNYLEAYQATGEASYRTVVEQTMAYVKRFLVDPHGRGFYASQDADVRTGSAEDEFAIAGEDYFGRDASARERAGLPRIDTSIYTDGNGMIAESFLKVFQVLGDREARTLALQALEHLYATRYVSGVGIAHREGSSIEGRDVFLSDQVHVARALLEAWAVTHESRYRAAAVQLATDMIDRFEDSQGGGFYDRPTTIAAPGLLRFPHKAPAVNLRAAMLFLDISYATGVPVFRESAERTLRYVLAHESSLPLGLTGLAVDRYVRYPVHVVVVGRQHDAATMRLFGEALRLYAPGKIVRWLDPDTDSLSVGEVTFPRLEQATAYICTDVLCSEPFQASSEFESRYQEVREFH